MLTSTWNISILPAHLLVFSHWFEWRCKFILCHRCRSWSSKNSGFPSKTLYTKLHWAHKRKWKWDQWPCAKTRPPTVAIPDKQPRSTLMFSRSKKYIAEQRGNWQHANRQGRAGYFWYETRSQDSQLSNFVIFKEIQSIPFCGSLIYSVWFVISLL